MVKATFSLDEETVKRLRALAARLRRPQSQVIREAVAEYGARADRLSEGERLRLLGVLESIAAAAPSRSHKAVDAERRALRRARAGGGRRHPIDR